jgi:hypothetical protein
MTARPISKAAHVQHLEDPPGSGLTACTGYPLPVMPDGGAALLVACTGCTVVSLRVREARAAHAAALDALEELIEGTLYTSRPVRYMVPSPAVQAAEILARARPQRWEFDRSSAGLIDLKGPGA